jgi:hypothetical protein
MKATYEEEFHGINYSAKRGEELKITASADEFYFSAWDGVLNLMSRSMCGRTAVFTADCDFYQGPLWLTINVKPGTPSYMKELAKVRPVSEYEAKQNGYGWSTPC